MGLHFDEYARKGKAFVSEVAKELKTDDEEKAGRMLRCVLRALRNRLTIEESFQLIGQLPLMIRAIYIDGWKVRLAPETKVHIHDFRTEVMKEDDAAALRDFAEHRSVDLAIKAVITVLAKHLPVAEMNHLTGTLPADIRQYLEDED